VYGVLSIGLKAIATIVSAVIGKRLHLRKPTNTLR